MATRKAADAKTQRINVWLTPEQIDWLKTKKNSSAEVRALITEAMNMENLAKSVKKRMKDEGGRMKTKRG